MSTPIPEQFQEQLQATVARLNAEEKMIAVPQGLLGSAVSAIDKKREGMMTVALLRHYAFNGDPAQASEYADAYQGAREDLSIWKRRALEAEAQLRQRPEPVADVVEWHKEGEERTCDIRWRRHDVAPGPLYTAPVQMFGISSIFKPQPVVSEVGAQVSEQAVPVVSFYRDGIVAAADWVEKQREAYDDEHGRTDPDTNTFEFSSDAHRDYSNTLAEIAEGIRALHPNAAAQPAPVVSEDLYRLANHIASSKNGLPDEWQDWAEELEADIRRAAMLAAAQQPAPVIMADLSDEDMQDIMRDLAVSRPDGIIVTPRQQPEPVAWQCLRKGPGRFVVTLERAVADEWARKGWPVRALCECNSQSAFVSATDYLRDRAKDPE